MEEYKLNRHFLCIDLKSFYASVECVDNNLDPFKTPVAVADNSRGEGSVVLAISPYLKSLGIKSRLRIYQMPKNIKIRYIRPRMRRYLEISTKIIGIYASFVSKDDLHVYSIDECFLDVTEYLTYYNMTDYELAKVIMKKVYDETKITATCGIGPNMLMSKLALDIDSKNCDEFIAKWEYSELPDKLWKVRPLSKMWGIGKKMEIHFNDMGFYCIGDIANSDINRLKKVFGVLGEEIYYHTHGIDMSMIKDAGKYVPKSKSLGIGQTLFKDTYMPAVKQLILEMCDQVTRRLRKTKRKCRTIHLSILYSNYTGGFSRQIKLDNSTDIVSIIFKICMVIFNKFYDGEPVRKIAISLANINDCSVYQYSLFEDNELLIKESKLDKAIDSIIDRYGNNSINRTSSHTKDSTIISRNKYIGGHHE